MNRNLRPLHLVPATLVTAIALFAVATGCGGKTEDTSSTNPSSTTSAAPETPAPADTGMTGGGALAGASIEQGKALYAQRCALCHGATGHGDGPGAKGLNPPPRNHTDATYMNTRTDEQLSEVIHKGKGAMPAWGKVLTDEQIASLVLYVRSLSKS